MKPFVSNIFNYENKFETCELIAILNIIIWQWFVLSNRAIWLAADEAGFSRIAHGQYAIFIALRDREESQVLNKQNKSFKLFKIIKMKK